MVVVVEGGGDGCMVVEGGGDGKCLGKEKNIKIILLEVAQTFTSR